MKAAVTAMPASLRSLVKPLLALLLCAGSAGALGAANINSATVNGVAAVNVVPGTALTINVNLTLTGNTDWQSTRITTSPASSLSFCSELPSYTSGGTYNQAFNVDAPNVNGSYTLVVRSYNGAGCTTLTDTGNFGAAIVTDSTYPQVLSIVRTSANPTNTSPVTWTLTFDRQVEGVTLDDFDFANTGVTGLSLSGTYFTNDTSVFQMSTTNTGSGTLGLNIVDNDSIVGPNGLPLGGVGQGNGDFAGQVYTIDRAGPAFPAVSIYSNNAFSTAFARTGEVVRVAFTQTDATTAQTPTATINGVAATITGAGANWIATRTMAASDPEGPVVFRLNGRDGFNNVSQVSSVTDGSSVTIDRTAPLAAIACVSACGSANPVTAGQVSWTVTFNEPVLGVGAGNFALSGTAATGASIASVSGGPSAYTVVANVSNNGVLGLNFSQNLSGVRDRAGNVAVSSTLAVAGNSYTVGGCSVAAGGGCTFNAVEPGGAIGSPIFTKRMGAPVTLDILAMNGAVLNTSSNDSVVATLVVADGSAACGTVAVSNAVTIAFAPANAGRFSVSFTPTRAGRDVRVRLVSSGVTACSADNFALRPDALSVSSSSATADSLGASFSAAPVFKAGSAPFGLQANAAVGYDGTPMLSQARLLAHAGAAGEVAGVFGAANAATGVANGASFTYSEVGYFRLGAWGAYDDGGFAAVDAIKGECFSSAALAGNGTPADPNIAVGGKLGCYFGSGQSVYFGRFIPDHFALSAGTVTNRSATASCAASTFTYMGEIFTASFVLTAQNFQNVTTTKYTGNFVRINIPTQLAVGAVDDPAPGVRRPLALCPATPASPVLACLALGTPSGSFTNGVSNAIAAPMTVLRAAAPVTPMTALKVGVAPIDSDGVRIGAYNLDTVNLLAGAPNRAQVGSTALRYGRLQVDNAYGSELLNLNVKVAAQYWNGSGYAANTLDSCTPLGAAGFTVTGQTGGITASNMNASHLVAGTAMLNGTGRVVLTKPTPAPTIKGRALLQSGSNYLPGTGRVTFGVYKSGPVIYLRETF